MTAKPRQMFTVECDFTGCPAELESGEGDGVWLYDTAEQARTAAHAYDWVTDGEHDYCDKHRDEIHEPAPEPTLRREYDVPLWEEP